MEEEEEQDQQQQQAASEAAAAVEVAGQLVATAQESARSSYLNDSSHICNGSRQAQDKEVEEALELMQSEQ